MRYVLLFAFGTIFGVLVQHHFDNAFVADTFHSSTSNFEENVMQGAALLDMCEAQARAK